MLNLITFIGALTCTCLLGVCVLDIVKLKWNRDFFGALMLIIVFYSVVLFLTAARFTYAIL